MLTDTMVKHGAVQNISDIFLSLHCIIPEDVHTSLYGIIWDVGHMVQPIYMLCIICITVGY